MFRFLHRLFAEHRRIGRHLVTVNSTFPLRVVSQGFLDDALYARSWFFPLV